MDKSMDLSRTKELMKQKNISVNHLATLVDAPQRTVDDFLKRGSGSFVLLYKISKVLGASMNELVGDNTEGYSAFSRNPINECADQLDKADALGDKAPDLTERYRAEAFEKRLPAAKEYILGNSNLPTNMEIVQYLELFERVRAVFAKVMLLDPIVKFLCEIEKTEESKKMLMEISSLFAERDYLEEARLLADAAT
jgi:transcriptional regulator with XRE-family HTH domain